MKTSVVAFAVLFAHCLLALSVVADVDVPSALVGTWEGELRFGRRSDGDRRRVLVITSVDKVGEGWNVAAQWGIPGQKLATPQTSLQVVGSEVTLAVRTNGGVALDLRLDGGVLLGDYNGTGRARAFAIRLEKTK